VFNQDLACSKEHQKDSQQEAGEQVQAQRHAQASEQSQAQGQTQAQSQGQVQADSPGQVQAHSQGQAQALDGQSRRGVKPWGAQWRQSQWRPITVASA